MTKKARCVEWVGDKCVRWTLSEDGRLEGEVNFGTCSAKTRKAVERDIPRLRGLRLRILEEKKKK